MYADAEPTRYRVKAWRQLAENIATLPRGARVLATGRVETEAYTDKTGQKRSADIVQLDGRVPLDAPVPVK